MYMYMYMYMYVLYIDILSILFCAIFKHKFFQESTAE